MDTNTFNFTPSVQEKILALVWTDSTYYNLYKDCVKPKYFQKAIHIDLCRIIQNYQEKYSKSPTKDVLTEEIRSMCEKSKTKQKLENDYLDCIDRLSDMDFSDYDYVKDRIIFFGKRQAMVEAIMKSAEIIENAKEDDDYLQIDRLVQSAQMVGEDVNDLGIDYWDGYESRIYGYNESEDVIERFPTGIGMLDGILKGGIGRTEMFVVLAPPGKGKTTTMINIGAENLKTGSVVVHISLENNEKQVIRNYDQRVLNKSIEYIKDNSEECVAALGRRKKYSSGGRLFVKKYPTKGASVDTIKMYVRRLQIIYNVQVDMVIVDYGAILKCKQSYSDKRNTIESNYEDLRALADELNVAMVTGAQGNRSSLSKKVVTIEDLAEAFAIANIADEVFALCQTIREKQEGKIRGFLTKSRDGADQILLSGEINYETKRMNFTQDISNTLADDESEDEEDDSEDSYQKYQKSKSNRRGKRKKTDEELYDES